MTLSPRRGDTVPKGHCRGEGHNVHPRGATANRSQNAQRGAPAPALGAVVGPPPDERSQMQINSDSGSQIPALLAVL